jgi:hypothetical protein
MESFVRRHGKWYVKIPIDVSPVLTFITDEYVQLSIQLGFLRNGCGMIVLSRVVAVETL